MVFFDFLIFFSLFLEFSITCRVRTEWKDNFYFFLFLGLLQPILAWNEAITVSFNLLNFFAILFWIFSYASGRNGTKRNDNFYFLSLSLFQPILAWNESTMVFFNFLILFSLFLEFSITCRVRTEWKDNFYFFIFLAISNLIWLEM